MLNREQVQVTKAANGALRAVRGRLPLAAANAHIAADQDPVVERVRASLLSLSGDLQMDAPGSSLKLLSDRTTAVGRHVRFQHTVDGIPVYGSQVVAQIADEQIQQLRVDRYLDRTPADKLSNDGEGEPKTTAAALAAVRAQVAAEEREIKHDVAPIWFPLPAGLRRAYQVDFVTAAADWRFVLDAYTLAVLLRENRRMEVDGTGMVYTPNPVVSANNNTFLEGTTPEATLNAQRVSRILKDISFDGTNYKLEGPYVQIKDADNNVAPPAHASSSFSFQRTEPGFEAVNVYFHVDSLQRYIQQELGITNVMNWSIPADHADAGSGAFYSPSSKRLGFGNSGPTQPDRGEDGDVMAHEYGHAIQDDIVPGRRGWVRGRRSISSCARPPRRGPGRVTSSIWTCGNATAWARWLAASPSACGSSIPRNIPPPSAPTLPVSRPAHRSLEPPLVGIVTRWASRSEPNSTAAASPG